MINAVLANETWIRILALGVIAWLVLQARSDKAWIKQELREIRDNMVTPAKMENSNRALADEIREWTEARFLGSREADQRFKGLEHRLDAART